MLRVGMNVDIDPNEMLDNETKYIFLIHSYLHEETWGHKEEFTSEEELEKFLDEKIPQLGYDIKLHRILTLTIFVKKGVFRPEVKFITLKPMTLKEFLRSKEFTELSVMSEEELFKDGMLMVMRIE